MAEEAKEINKAKKDMPESARKEKNQKQKADNAKAPAKPKAGNRRKNKPARTEGKTKADEAAEVKKAAKPVDAKEPAEAPKTAKSGPEDQAAKPDKPKPAKRRKKKSPKAQEGTKADSVAGETKEAVKPAEEEKATEAGIGRERETTKSEEQPKPTKPKAKRRPKKKTAKTEAEAKPEAETKPLEAAQPIAEPQPEQPAEKAKKPKAKKAGKGGAKAGAGKKPEKTEPHIKRIVVASKNPAKTKAVELGFSRMFPEKDFRYQALSVASGVGDQPMSDDETFAGALQRAYGARREAPDADFWVGLEGGIEEVGDELFAFAWMVVLGQDDMMGKSRTATFVLPPAVSELVREGKELGEADDIVFGTTDSKQSSGAIGILTHGLVDRPQYYSEAVVMALIPFKNSKLYQLELEEEELI